MNKQETIEWEKNPITIGVKWLGVGIIAFTAISLAINAIMHPSPLNYGVIVAIGLLMWALK